MSTPKLVRPDVQHEKSVRSLVQEFKDRDEVLVPWVLDHVDSDFEAYVTRLSQQACGQNLREGHVPHSTFFLLGASDEVVAVSNLRHWLNEFLQEVGGHIGFGVRPTARLRGFATEVLHCTVLEARRQGIENVLVTCKKGNVGSEQAISKNGGILESEIWSDMHSCIMRRFWISTTN